MPHHDPAPALGDHARGPARPPRARSRPRSAPASRRPAAPSRRSGPSSPRSSPSEVEEIEAAKARGENVWPVIDYADIAAGTVTAEQLAYLHAARLRRDPRPLRARAGARLGPGHRRLRRAQPVLRELPRPGRRLLRQRRLQARDLPRLLVTRADAGAPERADGERAVVPQPPLDLRDRRRAVVRPRPRLALPRPHPPPPARRELRRPRRAPRSRHARPLDDRGLPAGVPAPLRRLDRATTTRGTRRTAPPARSTRARRCARSSAPSRAGPRCRTWRTTRACCTPSRSPRRWPT